MTVSSAISRHDYTGNGVLDTYPFTFEIYVKTDLDVYVSGVLKTVDVHYTIPVADINNPAGGNVIFTAGNIPALNAPIAIILDLPLTQLINYVEGDKFPAETHEKALDRQVKIAQGFKEASKRFLKVAVSEPLDITVPVEADSFLKWNDDGNQIVCVPEWGAGDPLPDHAGHHENGGADEISLEGLSGAPAECAILAGRAAGQTLILGPNALANENYWGLTDFDYPATRLGIIEGSQASPVTVNECMSYFERHTAATAGDATGNYDMAKFITFFESGFALNSSIGRFEFRDRSGVNTKDRVGLFFGGGALAANSGRGLFGGWGQVFDHADSDYPSFTGMEIGCTILRDGLAYTNPWGGYGVTRTGFHAVNDGTLATHYRGHSAFNADGGSKKWQWGLAFRGSTIGVYGIAVTDTDIDGLFIGKTSNGVDTVFGVSNTGNIRTGANLYLQMTAANAGTIYFGSDNNDYISFNGVNYNFVVAGSVKARFDTSGNLVLYGSLYTGGDSPLKVVGARVIDVRCDDAINSGDATTDGVIDSLRDAMISHGLIAAA